MPKYWYYFLNAMPNLIDLPLTYIVEIDFTNRTIIMMTATLIGTKLKPKLVKNDFDYTALK